MSESFTVKIKVAAADAPALAWIGQLAAALEQANPAAVQRLVVEALAGLAQAGPADAWAAALALPGSEYVPSQLPFVEGLCGALEDAEAYLHISGSKKLNIELGGTDNGTGDAAAFLLALLQHLCGGAIDAKGQGFTWMAHWLREAGGVLRLAAHEPLDEGRRIDPKADEKLRRKISKDNQAFLATPLRGLVDALSTDQIEGAIQTVGLEQILGIPYVALMAQISDLPADTGLRYRVALRGQELNTRDLDNQLTIDVWNGSGGLRSLELQLRAQLPWKRLAEHIRQLPFPNAQIAAFMGHFDWVCRGIRVQLRLSEDFFDLRLAQVA